MLALTQPPDALALTVSVVPPVAVSARAVPLEASVTVPVVLKALSRRAHRRAAVQHAEALVVAPLVMVRLFTASPVARC